MKMGRYYEALNNINYLTAEKWGNINDLNGQKIECWMKLEQIEELIDCDEKSDCDCTKIVKEYILNYDKVNTFPHSIFLVN
jgi:hypothetical protein